jgi:molecular chaperone GrpE
LTPEGIEQVLAEFRSWLQSAAAVPANGELAPPGPAVDLHTLLGQFLALRHEVNLQTRATRNQQEQNVEALRLLGEALEELRYEREAEGAPESQDGEDQVRPLLKTLVDLYDALALGAREIKRGEETLGPLLDEVNETLEPPAEPAPPPSLWARWFAKAGPAGDGGARDERVRQAREALGRVRQTVDGLLTGYSMGLRRVDQALARHGLEPIPAAGRPFDPERMEVVEAAAGSGRPAGEVLEEVRRGYLWQGRVFRCAQVRVAKG